MITTHTIMRVCATVVQHARERTGADRVAQREAQELTQRCALSDQVQYNHAFICQVWMNDARMLNCGATIIETDS
jgi:hypothetical protein